VTHYIPFDNTWWAISRPKQKHILYRTETGCINQKFCNGLPIKRIWVSFKIEPVIPLDQFLQHNEKYITFESNTKFEILVRGN